MVGGFNLEYKIQRNKSFKLNETCLNFREKVFIVLCWSIFTHIVNVCFIFSVIINLLL